MGWQLVDPIEVMVETGLLLGPRSLIHLDHCFSLSFFSSSSGLLHVWAILNFFNVPRRHHLLLPRF
jgi:hypothetical protein